MAGGYWGSRYNSKNYFQARYWGLTGETSAGSMYGQAVGIANVTGDLSGFAILTGEAVGLATAMATLSDNNASMTGTATGSSFAFGVLSNANEVAPPVGIGSTGSGGAVGRRRRPKKKRRPDELTVEQQLELARARGALRKIEHLWGAPDRSLLPSWEEMKNEWETETAPVDAKRSAKPGPAFMIPETDSFEKITDASRRVIDQLLEEARRNALRDQEARKAAQIAEVQRALEDDEDDLEELLLLDFL